MLHSCCRHVSSDSTYVLHVYAIVLQQRMHTYKGRATTTSWNVLHRTYNYGSIWTSLRTVVASTSIVTMCTGEKIKALMLATCLVVNCSFCWGWWMLLLHQTAFLRNLDIDIQSSEVINAPTTVSWVSVSRCSMSYEYKFLCHFALQRKEIRWSY